MLEALESDLAGKTFTADALLTQTKLADFLIGRGAHYLFAVKGNRPNLLADLEFHFQKRGEPDFRERAQLRHGRIESRAIWTTATLNDYLTFPHVGQAFLVERTVTATHHILDCCWEEDRYRIRTGHGPENTTRLRGFAIGVIRSKSHCVASAVRRLNRKPRLVFDYLKMTKNTLHPKKLAPSSARTN